MSEKIATIGWQGITLKAPEDWSLVGVSGDDKKGYFQVDGPISSALQVKWSPALGKKPDLMARAREFLSTLEKSRKKQKFSSTVKEDKRDENSVNFAWRAEQLGQGKLTYCPDCDRVVIAQIVSTRDDNVSGIAPMILGSLSDHGEIGWSTWALYGLEFAVPKNYKIEKNVFMSGYLCLAFKSGQKTITVERWGLANILLSENEMTEWYRKDALPDIQGYRVKLEQGTVQEHEGLVLSGRRAGIKQLAKAVAFSLTLHPHPGLVSGYVWHCEESNRLFSVRATHTEGDDIAEKVRDTITCH